jgi:hypothetical protein
MIGTTAALIGMGIAAASSTASSVIGSKAAGNAASAQVAAENHAADVQAQSAKDSLDFQKKVYADNTANTQPYLDAGKVALGQIGAGLAPGGEFTQKYSADQVMKDDPGYQFRLDEGNKAIERAAAASGRTNSGGTLKALTRYGSDYASGEYGAAYSRFKSDQDTRFNRYATVAGLGQTATAQTSSNGNTAAGNVAAINSNSANGISNSLAGAANATASGYIGSANATAAGLGGLSNNATTLLMLSKLGKA